MMRTVLFVATFIGAYAIQSSTECRADLIAHWTGNGTSIDQTGGGHDGSLFGSATYAPGKIGQAFSFGGGSYFEASNSAGLQPSAITVAMWIKVMPSAGIQLLADSHHGAPGPNAGWALQLSNNHLSFAYGNGSSFPEIISTGILADNDFHHVAASLDGSSLRLYIDGALDATLAYSGTPTATGQNGGKIRLGNHYHFSRPLNGLIDDVRIYNTALNSGQVASLASVPEPSGLASILLVLSPIPAFRRNRR